jgi:hypothetical protein
LLFTRGSLVNVFEADNVQQQATQDPSSCRPVVMQVPLHVYQNSQAAFFTATILNLLSLGERLCMGLVYVAGHVGSKAQGRCCALVRFDIHTARPVIVCI